MFGNIQKTRKEEGRGVWGISPGKSIESGLQKKKSFNILKLQLKFLILPPVNYSLGNFIYNNQYSIF